MGYTALAASLDPEEVYRFLRPTMAALQRVVEEFGGTVPQVMGDGFLAVFGVPSAHEDDAERAVRAALAVRDHVRRLNEHEPGIAIPEVHSGVNSGEVMVAPSDEAAGFAVIGDTVNTAARLAGLAGAGQVLVDERTRNRTAHAIRFSPGRARRAKGKPAPLVTFEALGIRSDESPMRFTASGSIVDREEILERLLTELRSAETASRSRVLVLTAEPGAGKSRLAAELAARLPKGSVLMGRCIPYGDRLPLAALADAIGSAAGLSAGASEEEVDRAVRRLAGRVAPGERSRTLVRDLRLLLGRGGSSAPRGSVRDAARAARAVLTMLAREGPIALVLDDLHWADPDLLELLALVHGASWPAPVVILGLARPDLGSAARVLPRLPLEGLPEEHMLELAGRVLGPAVPESILRKPVARAGGNPLFLEESLGMLVEAGALEAGDEGWLVSDPGRVEEVPSTIRLLIAARLDGLPPREKEALQDASVSGEATWDQLVERLSGVGRRVMKSLEARDLLRRRPQSIVAGAIEYEFKHVLIRDVAYESLPRRDRAIRHLKVAEWLRSPERGLVDEPIAALAHHYEQAWLLSRSRTGPGAAPDVGVMAIDYLRRWGDRAFDYQARLAESIYQRGLRIARDPSVSPDPSVLAGLLTGRAEALLELRRLEAALADADEARTVSAGSTDPQLKARALLALGRAESDAWRTERARSLLDEARSLFAAAGDVAGQAWTLHRMSETREIADYRRSLADLRRAHELFAETGDRRGRSTVAQDLAYLLSTDGGPEFRRWYEEAERLVEHEGDLRSRAGLLRTSGYVAYYRWEHEGAIRVMREARPLAEEAGDWYVEVDSLLIESMAAAALGRLDEAEVLARRIAEVASRAGSQRPRILGLLAGVRPAVRSGKPRLAARRLRSALRDAVRVGLIEPELVEAGFHLDRGAWDRVSGPAEMATSEAGKIGWRLLEPVGPLLSSRSHLAAGRLEAAETEVARAIGLASAVDAPRIRSLAEAVRDQVEILAGGTAHLAMASDDADAESRAVTVENEGLALLQGGNDLGAAEAFERSEASWQELGLTVWLARAMAFRAEALRRAGRAGQARPVEARGRSILDQLETPARSRPMILSPLLQRLDT